MEKPNPQLAPSGSLSVAGCLSGGLLVLAVSAAILQVDDMMSLFWLGTLVNVALSITKMGLAQVTTHQKALMADAVHGLGDTAAEVVTALAYSEAAKPPDKEHPWGHGKIESVGAVVVTLILLYIALSMGYDSIVSLAPLLSGRWSPRSETRQDISPDSSSASLRDSCIGQKDQDGSPCKPGNVDSPRSSIGRAERVAFERWARRTAIAVGIGSVLLKEALYLATLRAGEQVQSNLAVATAWHHRSDSLAAGVALLSQLGSSMGGWSGFDPLGSGVVAGMVGVSAAQSLRESLDDLLDYNPASAELFTEQEDAGRCGRGALARTIAGVSGVRNHTLRTRRMGPYCLVDVTIIVDARISASAASMIAETVHDRVINDFRPAVTDVLVHVDPDGSPQSHRLETHSESSPISDLAFNPEDIETHVRAVLLQDEHQTDFPRITEVTELHTYFYEEHSAPTPGGAGEGDKLSSFVDVKVDFRLKPEDVSIQTVRSVARAARSRVLAALPGIVRDVDMNLQLDVGESEDSVARQSEGEFRDDRQSIHAPVSSCTLADRRTHGSWTAEPCIGSSPEPAKPLRGPDDLKPKERRLNQVTLIWERGVEARRAKGDGRRKAYRYGQRKTWRPAQSWPPLLVDMVRQHQGHVQGKNSTREGR